MTNRTTPVQSAFSFGELSPWMVARTKFEKYPGALETCINAIPLIEGGYMRRPGTRYIATVKDSTVKTRLKKFQFSVQQSHVLEMGAGYFRFYRHQGAISAADTDAAITNGTFDSDISDWDDRSTGTGSIAHDATNNMLELTGVDASNVAWAEQDVAIGASYQSAVHVLEFRVARAGKAVAGDEVLVRVGTTSTGTELVNDEKRGVGYHCIPITLDSDATIYIQFGNQTAKALLIDDVSLIDNATIEIGTPYAEADLFQIDGPQSADVLYLFHETYAPHKLERFANNEWSLTEVAWEDGPWLSTNTTSTTMNPSAATGLGITIVASAVTGINDDEGFKSTDVGRLIGIDNPSSGVDWGYARITGFTDTTTVTADVIVDFATANADATWRLGAWSDTTGWPKVGTFIEQRLAAAGTNDNPQTFWLSRSGADFEDFAPNDTDGTVADDNGMAWTISANEVNPIMWLTEQRNLVIGTNGGEWIVSSNGAALTPTDVTVKRHSAFGSARLSPLIAQGRILFVQRAGRKLIEFGFNFDEDAFIGNDLTRLARHITFGGLDEIAYAQQPHSTVYGVRGDGVLLAFTYNRREQIEGWSRLIFGGSFSGGNPVCDSVASIPGQNGAGQTQDSTDRDEVWVIVKRTIDGSTVRYIEMMERSFETGHDQDDAYYVDSLLTYDGTSTITITGLPHLEGETVGIWADSAIQADKTVSSAQITLDTAASNAQAGLRYTHTLKTLKLDFGAMAGSAIGEKKRVDGAVFVLLNSHTLKAGPTTSNLDTDDFRVVSDAMDAGVTLFTGEWAVDFEGNWEVDPRIIVQSDDPAPFTLLAIAPKLVTSEMR